MNKPLFLALGLAGAGFVALAATSDFTHPADSNTSQQFTSTANPQRNDTPSDPGYDCYELDTANPPCTQFDNARFDLFGFPASSAAATALYTDPTDAARVGKPQVLGFNAAGAWKIERGRGDVVISILDTGIRWDKRGLRKRIALNRNEL